MTKQEYIDRLKAMNERYKPRDVVVESVAAQEYLAQDLEKLMPVHRLERTKDKVSRAYWRSSRRSQRERRRTTG